MKFRTHFHGDQAKKRTRDGDEESYQEWRTIFLNEDLDFNEHMRHDKEVLLKLSEITKRLAELEEKDAKIESVTKKIERKLNRVCKK